MTGLPERILAEVGALPPGPLVVALSGGPDSAMAAWVATGLDPPRMVTAVFVDHGWPGSPTMATAATAVARHLGIELAVLTVTTSTTEGEARALRLAALEAHAGATFPRSGDSGIGASGTGAAIVTGHHADDQAETVVLNLLRGAGARGLSAIPSHRAPYVRPLLGVDGVDLRKAAEELGLPFADDPANADGRHRRTRVRTEVLPALEAVEPSVRRNLVRTAATLAADDGLIGARADQVPVRLVGGAVLVPWGPLQALPEPVAARIVRRALRLLHPPYAGDARDVAIVLAGGGEELSGGLRCERDGAHLAVYNPGAVPPVPEATPLPVPAVVPFGAVEVATDIGTRPPGAGNRHTAWLDPAHRDGLVLRPAGEGERVDLGGRRADATTGSKPVRQAMAEAGIPARLRPGWPVVSVHGKIAWVVGARVAAWASASPSTPGVRITMERR